MKKYKIKITLGIRHFLETKSEAKCPYEPRSGRERGRERMRGAGVREGERVEVERGRESAEGVCT